MQYILTDKLDDGYCFGRYPSLELARAAAHNFPKAIHIHEYKDAGTLPAGIVPTGVNYEINTPPPNERK